MPLTNPILLNNFKRVIDPNENYLLTEDSTTSWSKIMKGVKSGESGPWSLIAIDNKKVSNKEFHAMADNFFNYMMTNFETELVVMGAKIALKTYGLPIEPSQLKNFDDFHKKYGKYIVEAGN